MTIDPRQCWSSRKRSDTPLSLSMGPRPHSTYSAGVIFPPYFVSSILSGLKLFHQPLELSSRICGVDQEPKVLTRTKIHIERDEAEARAWSKGIEAPNSETK